MANNEDKKKALDAAIAKLEKDFGKGTVMKLGDPAAQVSVETIPTVSLSLDIALGLGGVPRGRVVEIYGPESSLKKRCLIIWIVQLIIIFLTHNLACSIDDRSCAFIFINLPLPRLSKKPDTFHLRLCNNVFFAHESRINRI